MCLHRNSGLTGRIHCYSYRVEAGLFGERKTFWKIEIGAVILLVLLGLLVAFAQSQEDFPPPDDFRLPDDFRPRRGFRPPGDFPPPDEFRGRRGLRIPRDFLPFEDISSMLDSAPIDPPYPAGDYEFIFARMVYTGGSSHGNWTTDWPKSDRQFILGIKRLTNIRVADEGVAISLTNPDLFKYPFLYSVECGSWNLTDDEIIGLREYLKRGGLLFCDDFWGTYEWENFQMNLLRVLPEARIEEIPLSHKIFHCYYDVEELVQIPNIMQALSSSVTYEADGYIPHFRGIFDDQERLMVLINWNTDLGDAWEWADLPEFPTRFSTHAYQLGINAIIYAMSH